MRPCSGTATAGKAEGGFEGDAGRRDASNIFARLDCDADGSSCECGRGLSPPEKARRRFDIDEDVRALVVVEFYASQ